MLMDKEKLLQIFDYLNERLKANQLQLSEVNQKLLENILEMAKFTFNLSENWINEEIKEPLKSIIKEEIETYKVYSNLKILKPKAEQLLAMKILAARPEPAKDFIDAFILCKDLNIRTKEELLNTVEKYLPLTLIGERQIRFIKYLGEDLGHDWE